MTNVSGVWKENRGTHPENVATFNEDVLLAAYNAMFAPTDDRPYVFMHTGDPGADGTANRLGIESNLQPYGGDDRTELVFETVEDCEWYSSDLLTGGTVTHLSVCNDTSGVCVAVIALAEPIYVPDGGDITIPAGDPRLKVVVSRDGTPSVFG